MELLVDPQAWIALATLAALEIVLGVDNIIFITILVGRLPAHQRNRARVIGLGLAMGAHTAIAVARVDHDVDRAALHRNRHGYRGPGSDPDRRRPVPAVEKRA